MKFRLKEDWFFGKSKIMSKGTILSPNDDFKYKVEYLGSTMFLSMDDIESDPLFEPLVGLNIDIRELDIDESEKVKNWRIQLDIKTSFKKLKLIEEFLKENINDML
jgi:hypothetical protein